MGGYSDDPGGSRTNDAGQEKTGEEEVTEMVNANVHLEAVLCVGLGIIAHTCEN